MQAAEKEALAFLGDLMEDPAGPAEVGHLLPRLAHAFCAPTLRRSV